MSFLIIALFGVMVNQGLRMLANTDLIMLGQDSTYSTTLVSRVFLKPRAKKKAVPGCL